jgi:hypothetical protein
MEYKGEGENLWRLRWTVRGDDIWSLDVESWRQNLGLVVARGKQPRQRLERGNRGPW